MTFFPCPYLGDYVELSNEREQHIENRHPDLLPTYRAAIEKTLADPDQIRQSRRFGNARLFNRWFSTIRGGKYVIVVVVSESYPTSRHWIITAYMSRKLAKGAIEWTKT